MNRESIIVLSRDLAQQAQETYNAKTQKNSIPNIVKDRQIRTNMNRTQKDIEHALHLIKTFYEIERFSPEYYLSIQKLDLLLQETSFNFHREAKQVFD